jgi:two-component system chemotaxis response regulator CheY
VQALVVDDSRAMRTILGKIVTSLGFDVITAVHGKDALDQLTAGARPQLMLLDWNMPEMNGYELLQCVRKDPAHAAAKIIMVTTETEMTRVVKALGAGLDAYVMKPFTKEAVVEQLERIGFGAN